MVLPSPLLCQLQFPYLPSLPSLVHMPFSASSLIHFLIPHAFLTCFSVIYLASLSYACFAHPPTLSSSCFLSLSLSHPPNAPAFLCLPPLVPAGRGPIPLWQFLLDLMISPDKSHMIQWTGNGYEFRITKPEDVAMLWGARKNKPKMNYDKLSRGLRYYYSKGIMDKVPGKKLTFKYTCDVQHYVKSRNSQAVQPPFGDQHTNAANSKAVQLPFGNQHINATDNSDIEVKSEL